MRITIFTLFDTALNPYILLFRKALEGQGISVRFERNFNLRWLIFNAGNCESIHLHWITYSYSQPTKERSKIFKSLFKFKLVRIFLDLLSFVDFILAFMFAKILGKKIVFTVHDLYDFEKISFRGKIQREITRNIVFRFSNAIHAHNEHTRRLVESRYHCSSKVVVIPHGNFIGYYPNNITKDEARKKLRLPSDSLVFLFLGLLRPYKGIEDLFTAFGKLDNPEARLVVAGRVFDAENYEAALRKLAQADSRTKLVPEFIPDDDLQLYFNACDVFVLPYKDITTSGAAALALSFGRPIIAPAITSFPEVVTPESGILYDPSDPEGLLNALKKAEGSVWSEEKIFEYAHNEFDWQKLGVRLAALYNK